MSRRKIWAHLLALTALLAVGALLYGWQASRFAVPLLIQSLTHDDPALRRFAIAKLQFLGPAAKASAPHLFTLAIQDPSVKLDAAGALKEVDPSAARRLVPIYVEALKARRPPGREAPDVLGALGPIAKPAVPALVAVLKDHDASVRRAAVAALGSIGIPSAAIVPALLQALEDKDVYVRHGAVSVFAFSGLPRKARAQALPALARRKQDEFMVKQLAEATVSMIEHDPANHPNVEIQTAIYGVKSDGRARAYSLHKLAKMGADAIPALNAIIEALSDPHPLNRYLAAEALGAIGARARQAAPFLLKSLNDDESIVRAAATEALAAIGTDPPKPKAEGVQHARK